MSETSAPAAFSAAQRALLLDVPYVGPTVIARLEEIGIGDLEALAAADAEDICGRVSAMLGSSCWANSHQARKAISGAIEAAQKGGAA